MHIYIYISIHMFISNNHIDNHHNTVYHFSEPLLQEVGYECQGFQGTFVPYSSGIYSLSIRRIRYLVPRMFGFVGFNRLAILRVEGCLNSTL